MGYDASLVPEEKREIVALFQANDQIARILLTTNGGAAWLRAFLTGWEESGTPDTLYGTRSRNCNLLLKRAFGKLVVRNAELMIANATAASFANDPVRMALLSEAENYRFFMAVHDQRNMPVFPETGVIPPDSYMLMGDNRFNSLDMRHSYSVRLAPVDPADSLSFMYYSNLEPQYVPVERISGTASFRFWPVTRIGVPANSLSGAREGVSVPEAMALKITRPEASSMERSSCSMPVIFSGSFYESVRSGRGSGTRSGLYGASCRIESILFRVSSGRNRSMTPEIPPVLRQTRRPALPAA